MRRPGAIALAVLFLALHLPFLPKSLEDLDSINFALGMRHFDVAQHQPHPPGYPLFIFVANIFGIALPSEAAAMAVVSVLAGALAVFSLVALFTALDDRLRDRGAILATLVTIGTPLFWFTASRPLSDLAGLAPALAIQALILRATTTGQLAAAGFLAAFATGVRSQVAWLTVPLLAWRIVRSPSGTRFAASLQAALAAIVGALLWLVPLVLLSGGPREYWRTVTKQGAEDLSGIVMLWTTPTLRQLWFALTQTFVAPWVVPALAALVLAIALVGVLRVLRTSPGVVVTLLVAFGPYFVFDLLLQETATTRYALPIIPVIAYFVVRAVDAGDPRQTFVPVALALIGITIAQAEVTAYARSAAPAFRLLEAMHERLEHGRKRHAPPPVAAMHRREELDLRRPLTWVGDNVRFAAKLPAPPKHEWLELVKYWNSGGRADIWHVADPLRTDLALVDHDPGRGVELRWPLAYHSLIGGVRPDVMDWTVLRQPGWYLGEGWALTPETAGVAKEDGHGPGIAPIIGWIRRRPEAATMMIGGRNLLLSGPAVKFTVAIDGRVVDEPIVEPGFFLRTLHLPAGALEGSGDYATITVSADRPHAAIEQFDVQSSDRLLYGYDAGWQEPEYNPTLGLLWRWTSDRATVRVHAAGRAVALTLAGDRPLFLLPPSWPKRARVRISAGGRVFYDDQVGLRFAIDAKIPADALAGDESAITIETDQWYVPAERSRRSHDRRRLGLRVLECRLRVVPH